MIEATPEQIVAFLTGGKAAMKIAMSSGHSKYLFWRGRPVPVGAP